MSNLPFFLDVNVPMYAAGKPHPYQAACAWIMTEIAHGRATVAIDTEIIQEILFRFGALQQWQVGTQMASTVLALVPEVYAVTRQDAVRAVALFAAYGSLGVRARDIVHVAVMQGHGLTSVISTDTHFDLVPGIVRLDPVDLFQRQQIG
jgi:predicted nucleic acid-binding protein